MKFKKFLIIFFMFMLAFIQPVNAYIDQPIPVANTYKQGIHSLSGINPFNASAKLITPNNVTSLIILDSKGNQKFYKRFDTVDEVVNLGIINNGDIVAIIGSGEIAITFSK